MTSPRMILPDTPSADGAPAPLVGSVATLPAMDAASPEGSCLQHTDPARLLLAGKNTVVVLGNGAFPVHPEVLNLLRTAPRVVCCDGAVRGLLRAGREPDFIVGDMDSLCPDLAARFSDRLVCIADQQTNDQTKAVHFCAARGWTDVRIVGATGLREDHTLGNLSLLGTYLSLPVQVCSLTDHGIFLAVRQRVQIPCIPGQVVSVFSFTPQVPLTTRGLQYPLHDRPLLHWWEGTLNRTVGTSFELDFSNGVFMVYVGYPQIPAGCQI